MNAPYLRNSEPEFYHLGSKPEGMWVKPPSKDGVSCVTVDWSKMKLIFLLNVLFMRTQDQ